MASVITSERRNIIRGQNRMLTELREFIDKLISRRLIIEATPLNYQKHQFPGYAIAVIQQEGALLICEFHTPNHLRQEIRIWTEKGHLELVYEKINMYNINLREKLRRK